jgi:NDP-sugar pyrophosphorylase family protein
MPRDALVLTAGLGTRLRPLTDVRAKPAIPVAGEPLIRRIIAWLVGNGVTDLVLNLHHLPGTLTACVGDGSDLSARVRYSWEQPEILGSAGGPRQAVPILGAGTFLIVNGDTLTDLDLPALAAAHAASGALVTLALVPNVEPLRYGGVRLGADGAVTGFVARGPAAAGSHHFIGVQMVSADVFRGLPAGKMMRSIGGVYDELIAKVPGAIRGYVCHASFWDVGTPDDYLKTSDAFSADPEAVQQGRRVRIDPSARISRSILWDDVEVGARTTLDRCIVTDRVRVPAGSMYRDAVLIASPGGEVVAHPMPEQAPQSYGEGGTESQRHREI